MVIFSAQNNALESSFVENFCIQIRIVRYVADAENFHQFLPLERFAFEIVAYSRCLHPGGNVPHMHCFISGRKNYINFLSQVILISYMLFQLRSAFRHATHETAGA
jgi:hypothetical protein